MKITKSFLKQLIKEEMNLLEEKPALNEGYFENLANKKLAWACTIQRRIGREKTKRIAKEVFASAKNWKNIIRKEFSSDQDTAEWLIEQADSLTWAGFPSGALSLYVKSLSDEHYKWYLDEIDERLGKCKQ